VTPKTKEELLNPNFKASELQARSDAGSEKHMLKRPQKHGLR
jgi:hypothetical protein